MGTQKHVVLIPYWVEETLRRNSVHISDCTDISKVQKLFSLEDLAIFFKLQSSGLLIYGANSENDLQQLWREIATDNLALYDFYSNIDTLSNDPTIVKSLQDRLFNQDAKNERYEKAFNVIDLSADVVGVVIYPGFFIGNGDLDLQYHVVTAVLKLLYVYDDYTNVSKTSMFTRYLKLLSEK
jgi:hypothetical protein